MAAQTSAGNSEDLFWVQLVCVVGGACHLNGIDKPRFSKASLHLHDAQTAAAGGIYPDCCAMPELVPWFCTWHAYI